MKVAVTGINATDNPGPGVSVARSLKEANPQVEIIGLSYDINDPGHYMDFYIDSSYLLNTPSNGWPGIFEKLKLIKETNGLDYIIPCLDAELPLFMRNQKDLESIGVSLFLPTEKQFGLRDKSKLSELSKEIGLKYPKTYLVNSHEEIDKTIEEEELVFPLIVKGKYYKAYIVHNSAQCKYYFNEISMEWGFPILIQECVYGEELNLVGVGDGKGGDLGLFPIKKLTTTAIGKIWTGVTVENKLLVDTAKMFIEKTKWKGPFELECIFNNEDCYLIEINPRFPAWLYFATGAGMNLPQNMIDFNEGKKVDVNNKVPLGKLFVRYTQELVTDINKMANIK